MKFVNESIKRMEIAGLSVNIIRHFYKENVVMCSDVTIESVRYLSEKEWRILWAFEKESGGKVYHAIKDKLGMLSFLYVSKYEEEWAEEREDVVGQTVLAYVYNPMNPICSELRYISFRKSNGNIYRFS